MVGNEIYRTYHRFILRIIWHALLLPDALHSIGICADHCHLWSVHGFIIFRNQPKKILAGVIAVFAIANLVSAFAPNYSVLLFCRILPAFLHPVYFSLAFAAAASSVPKEQSATAVSRVFTGLTVGMVLGVPFISFIGDQFSLEAAFLFAAVINASTFIGIISWIPSMPVKEKLSYGKQLNILIKLQLWLNKI
ncbi:MFS transporter [Paenibacillus durus]|uniref:MFS transporter n=1 Tax=Paenibacillus durus TaxID=44251 RepID=UPI001E58A589|nr:MFS transporter [Paenibacillus durus]